MTGTAALWVMIVAALLAVANGSRPNRALLLTVVSTVAGSVALVRLGLAFVRNEWAIEYVADHSRSGLSPLLRLAGLWAGPEGSLLLWTVLVALMALVSMALTRRIDEQMVGWIARLGGALTAAYGALVALVANPFDRLPIPPVDGLGLQPILEHPAMVWHPPVLYLGLTGLLVPTLVVASALLSRRALQPPTAVVAIPLGFLAAGLITGARWAHAELGWGGFWAWDPIESAGLVAWLVGLAGLHGLRSRSMMWRSEAMAAPTALLVLLSGVSVIWATTLTRIGVIDSVHTFADRPTLRTALVILASVASVVLLIPVARAAHETPTVGMSGLGRSRQPGRRLASGVLFAAALLVALGAYEPLVEAATVGDTVSIAGSYFTRVLWPVVMVGAVVVIWGDRRWLPAAVGAVLAVLVTPVAAGPFGLAVAAAGGGIAGSTVALVRVRRGALAHLGAGILLVGVAGTMATEVDVVTLFRGRPVTVAGEALTFEGIELLETTTSAEAVATIRLADGETLQPSVVSHSLRNASTAEIAHRFRLSDELQVVFLDGADDRATFRVIRHPRLPLVWLGASLVVLGLLAAPARQSLRRLRANNRSTVDVSSSAESSSDPGGIGLDGLGSVTSGGRVGGGAVERSGDGAPA